ncbi:TPA: hypothetical protein QDZ23_000149 [Pseudomonas putida]|nr:hypothetical protein [Pseudomonas putida]
MKPKNSEILMPDHAMYEDAVEALKRLHDAQASGRPADEIERLRMIAESQFQAVTDYQLKALGGPVGPVH